MSTTSAKRKADDIYGQHSNGPRKRRALEDEEAKAHFFPGLFDSGALDSLTRDYSSSQPFKHGVIRNLLDPGLLRNVRDEIRANISFTAKETDIYKIFQSGDLANLDGLDEASLALLPSLATLRDALYSAPFRHYLSHVTGSGPLSGDKTDMAVNVYTPTCHLLCHDDVIGTRRVSYILYLTDPDKPWKPEWGGALRLYSTQKVKEDSDIIMPNPYWSHSIPPAFNQLSFFAVQPGQSFHDVEEVYPAAQDEEDVENEGGRIRMAISGWFHIPQEGEEGYQQGAEERQAEYSSLAQLQGNNTEYDLPQPNWILHDESIAGASTRDQEGDDSSKVMQASSQFTETEFDFLLRFMNPRYLLPETCEELSERFAEDCSIRLAMFLGDRFASELKSELEALESTPGSLQSWVTSRPPHKHRFKHLTRKEPSKSLKSGQGNMLSPLSVLFHEFFPSLAFRKWLANVTNLSLDACDVLARRFRRGLDYTLATSQELRDPQLEVCLNITPSLGWGGDVAGAEEDEAEDDGESTSRSNVKAPETNSAEAEAQSYGGYEVYMVGDDAANDSDHRDEPESSTTAVTSTQTGAGQRTWKKKIMADPAVYSSGDADNEDDGILISSPPSWNSLNMVLRDRGILRFIKYVSQSAPGDRWDLFGIWKVEEGFDDDDDDDESNDSSGNMIGE